MTNLVVVVFGVWFTAMVGRQFVPAVRRVALRFDRLHLLPSWALFGWREPLDFTCRVRVAHRDGSIGPWIEIPVPSRPLAAGVWHPQLLARHRLKEIGHALARRRPGVPREETDAYRAIVRYLKGQIEGVDATAFQFAVDACVLYDSTTPATTVFQSQFLGFDETMDE